jgi:hypothetical protein
MNGSPVADLVRGWVNVYTRGLPAELRDARRDEVDDDLWCEHEEAAAIGRSRRSLDVDLGLRLVFGVPADISWRLAYRRDAAPAILERSPSRSTRTIGASAVIAVLSTGFLGVLGSKFGSDLGGASFVPLILGSIILGAIAFLVAALGLAWLYQDRVGPLGNLGAIAVVLGAFTTISSGIAAPIFVGSAMLMWDLARIGVVSWLVPIVHVATAVLFIVGIPNVFSGASFSLYLVTWGAVGVMLIRGVPQVHAPSA